MAVCRNDFGCRFRCEFILDVCEDCGAVSFGPDAECKSAEERQSRLAQARAAEAPRGKE